MDAPSLEASSNQINDAQTSNGIKDPMCLVDIPMPSANESQSQTTTSKDGILISNTNSNESLGELGASLSEKSQNDMQRQLNLISAPPPPPPDDQNPKSTLSSNVAASTQRTVNMFNFILHLRINSSGAVQ